MTQEAMVALIRRRGVKDRVVLEALQQVPRHQFVPQPQQDVAYEDYPLPIGYHQTISQPYIVALMTEALELEPGERVLELGTGSGYQAAILAAMGMEVYTVERVPELHETAREHLQALGYAVQCRLGDGHSGWPEFAPYDGIMITAAPPEIPEPLWAQLADGGRMVAPIGPPHGYQTLWKFIKRGKRIEKINLGGVAFVPFIGDLDTNF
ncbi:MAG: protein-L-isoaspartate(D-aspartate) O-methyltransferase [Anaerolineae bacterium]|nr:protein-L-isoaspartate(D-aspartate) O-methyltransferase [Anaerolineae bacterium]